MLIYAVRKSSMREAISFTRTIENWKENTQASGLKCVKAFAILSRAGKLIPANNLCVEKCSFRADKNLCQI